MDPDLAFVAAKEESMPGFYWYLAGTIRSKSGLSIGIVLNLLKVVHQNLSTYPIPEESKAKIFNFLLEGNVALAKSCLDSTLETLKKSSKMLEFELVKLIQEMKADPLFSQSLQLKLQASASFTCQLCSEGVFVEDIYILDNCPHAYHKACISSYLTMQISSKAKKLACPAKACGKEISENDLPGLVTQELVKKFQDDSFQYGLESGIYGKVISCPTCSEKFVSDEKKIVCHRCLSNICGTCLKVSDSCTCHPIIFRRQCPRCSQWTNKNGEQASVCRNCGCRFCFNCNQESNICKCWA